MDATAAIVPATPRPRSRSLVFAGTFVLLALVAAAVWLVPQLGYVALSASYLGALLAYLGLRSDGQGGDLFEVIIPLGVLSFLYFGVGTLYLVFVPEAMEHIALMPYLLPAQALMTLGFVCMLVGYGGFFRTTAPSPLRHFAPRGVFVYMVPAVLGTLGMSVTKFQVRGMASGQGISASLSFVQQFGPLFLFGWFLAWYMWWSGRLRASIAVPMLTSMSAMAAVILFFTFGSKTLALTLLAMPALAFYEVKRKLPIKSIVVVALIFVFVIFPTYNSFRQVDHNLDTSRRVDRALELTQTWNSDKYLDASVFAFFKRLTVVTSVAAIVSDVGRWVDYRYGETLILAPIGLLIPRFLWPDKPNLSIGREFGATFQLKNVMDTETEISPTMVGEFYWNFSVPGVIVGMWLLGMGYRWYYQRYGAGTGFDPIRKAIYFTLLPPALLFEDNVAIIVAGLIKVLAILIVFLVLCRRLGWLEENTDL